MSTCGPVIGWLKLRGAVVCHIMAAVFSGWDIMGVFSLVCCYHSFWVACSSFNMFANIAPLVGAFVVTPAYEYIIMLFMGCIEIEYNNQSIKQTYILVIKHSV